MPVLSSIRAASLLGITALCVFVGTFVNFAAINVVIICLAYSHYLAGLYYSRKQISSVMKSPLGLSKMVFMIALGFLATLKHFPLLYYFTFHHIFNETYLLNRTVGPDKVPALKPLRLSAMVLHFFAYFFIFRWHPSMPAFIEPAMLDPLLFCGVMISTGAFLIQFRNARGFLTRREQVDNCFFEVLTLGICVASLFTKIYFMQLVGYHFIFWILYPLSKILEKGAFEKTGRETAKFLGWTVGLTGLFLVISPIGAPSFRMPERLFAVLFILLSNLQISLSWGLSDAQPDWLVQFFRPKKTQPLAEPALVKIDSR
jgi:hypothetical protein